MAQCSNKKFISSFTRGFTLVELMVAVTISAIVIAVNIYFSAKYNYQKRKQETEQDIKALVTKNIL